MNIALITGASSGLGREFARQVSRDPHVQAVWAVARREDRLRQLASLCACPVRPVPLDLTDPQSLDALRDLLAREKPTVTRLVCAAGVGKMGRIDAVSPADSLGMIDLNCRAAVGVTQLCLPYLTRGSRVLELCSTAAFQPMPGGLRGLQGLSPELYENPPLRAPPPGDSRHRCLPLLGEGHRVHPPGPGWQARAVPPLSPGLPEPVGGLPLPGRQRPEPVGGHAGDCLHPAPAGGEGDSPCAAGAADGWAAAGVRG